MKKVENKTPHEQLKLSASLTSLLLAELTDPDSNSATPWIYNADIGARGAMLVTVHTRKFVRSSAGVLETLQLS